MLFQNRIVKFTEEALDSLMFHPDNWRIHPARQQAATKAALEQVGWVDAVLVNLRTGEEWPEGERNVTTLIDGHMRVLLASRNHETTVPVKYVDLTPEEEAFVLATYDPLGQLAVTDGQKLMELAGKLDQEQASVRAALRGAGMDLRKEFGHLAEETEKPKRTKTRNPFTLEPGPGPNQPEERERYPLAIVIDRRTYQAWQTFKDGRNDTAAFIDLFSQVVLILKEETRA